MKERTHTNSLLPDNASPTGIYKVPPDQRGVNLSYFHRLIIAWKFSFTRGQNQDSPNNHADFQPHDLGSPNFQMPCFQVFRTQVPFFRTTATRTRTQVPFFRATATRTRTQVPFFRTTATRTRTQVPFFRATAARTRTQVPFFRATAARTRTQVPFFRARSIRTRTQVPFFRARSIRTRTQVPFPKTTTRPGAKTQMAL